MEGRAAATGSEEKNTTSLNQVINSLLIGTEWHHDQCKKYLTVVEIRCRIMSKMRNYNENQKFGTQWTK